MKLLTKYYGQVQGKVLPFEKFRLFSDLPHSVGMNGDTDTASVVKKDAAAIIANAEAIKNEPYPLLLASDFIRFEREGNRSVFEAVYFHRRDLAVQFALAEAIEQKGNYTDRVMDGISLILDEQDWVIPAHIDHKYPLNPWYREHPYIDLFAAETGSLLSFIYLFMKEKLNAITPILCDRLVYEVKQRIITPFLTHDMYWMGFDGQSVNNWNPWILLNVLTATALTEPDTEIRELVVDRVIRSIDNFIGGYHSDGGCDEGPSYWTAAGAAMFHALELLYDMTDGYIDIFGEPLIRRMGEYEADFHICGSYYVNFADCPSNVTPGYRYIARYGRRVNSDRLRAFGEYYESCYPANMGKAHWMLYSHIKSLYEPCPVAEKNSDDTRTAMPYRPSLKSWYDGICVMTERETDSDDKGFFLAVKGGHNAESHNHNDVGTFIVYLDGKPLFPDVGVGAYTKKTFSSQRYTIWSMCSDYHNLPTVNGVTQSAGGQYRATDVDYSAANHSLGMNIASAYRESAGLVSLHRTVSLNDGVVTVDDDIRLKEAGNAVWTLMCAEKPEIDGKTVTVGGAFLHLPDNMTARLDEAFDMCAEDDSIKTRWHGREIYRLLLTTDPFTDGRFTVTITH